VQLRHSPRDLYALADDWLDIAIRLAEEISADPDDPAARRKAQVSDAALRAAVALDGLAASSADADPPEAGAVGAARD
jgi:hypothetical protein